MLAGLINVILIGGFIVYVLWCMLELQNIFKGKKVDSGGNANRDSFKTVFHWLWNNNKNQFILLYVL